MRNRRLRHVFSAVAAAAVIGSMAAAGGAARGSSGTALAAPVNDGSSCSLAGGVHHVIYIQFDNVHLARDLASVPSDLEQMPHLLSFIENNGVMLANHHTPLIAHTSEDILTSLTGVYPSRHGVAVGQNSYQYFQNGDPTPYTTAFTYWTDTIGNGTYNMLSGAPTPQKPTGTNAPAPWVPFTRAGCDVGGVATANLELENANVNSPYGANDIGNVFGVNSPQAAEPYSQRYADFVGVAVHCSQADSAANGRCSSANNGRPDVLPDEPGGYSGFNALYGHKYVAPQIGGTGPGGTTLTNLNGNTIQDSQGNKGFPGFDGMNAATSLAYVAAMQEHGIPVTYAYISDAHDLQGAKYHTALGSGEQQYVQQLKAYDDAFGTFFQRLANDGINKSNTLFVFTADENDHFNGIPLNPGCTGATINNATNPPTVVPGNYCMYDKTYSSTPPGPEFGEVAVGLQGLLYHEQGFTSPQFSLGNDTAPGVYIAGQPGPTDPTVRAFEQNTGQLTVYDQLSGQTQPLAQYQADPVEMKILHMVTADPARTPTETIFGTPDLYITGTCKGGYDSDPTPVYTPSCVLEEPAYAWLHGNVQPDITNTWLGMVGPEVQHLGLNHSIWSDHTDIRPTLLALLGLRDDYVHDGRVLAEVMNPSMLPSSVSSNWQAWVSTGQIYKQLNAPVGAFGLATLAASTDALNSSSPGDQEYTSIERQLTTLGQVRDIVARNLETRLNAPFNVEPAPAGTWALDQRLNSTGNSLIAAAESLDGTTR